MKNKNNIEESEKENKDLNDLLNRDALGKKLPEKKPEIKRDIFGVKMNEGKEIKRDIFGVKVEDGEEIPRDSHGCNLNLFKRPKRSD